MKNVLCISKELVLSTAGGLAPDASVLAIKDGKCVEVSGSEMKRDVEAEEPGYMLYALLLPGMEFPDLPIRGAPRKQARHPI